MTTEKFIEAMVKIELDEETEKFQHYPFHMISIDKENKITAGALFLGGDVVGVYNAVKREVINGAQKVFVSIDFPPGGDIDTDFVAIYTLTDRFVECVALPYNPANGKRLPIIKTGKMLYALKKQFEFTILF